MTRRLVIVALLAGLVARVIALPLAGTGDTIIWKVWSFAAASDLTAVYGIGGSPPERRVLHWQGEEMTVDYPPIALAELGLMGKAYRLAHPLADDSRTLNVFVKLPGVLAEIAVVAVLLTWGRRRLGDAAATWTAIALWINPAILLDGPVLGYLDPQMAMPALLALMAAVAGPVWLAGALAAVAVLTKAQAVFVLPVIGAAVILRRDVRMRDKLSSAASAIAAAAVVLVPYAVRGAWSNLTQAVGRLATHDMLSAQSANLWWIVTWALRVQDVAGEWGWRRALTQEVRILAITRASALGVPNARVVGLVLVAACVCWSLWRLRRESTMAIVAFLTGWVAYGYATLAAQVHENHLYLALPFFALAAGLDARLRRLYWAISAIFALNLLMFYGLGRDVPFTFDRGWTGIDASVLLSVVNLGVFAWCTRVAMTHCALRLSDPPRRAAS